MALTSAQKVFTNRYFDLYPKEVAGLLEPLAPTAVGEFLQQQSDNRAAEILEQLAPEAAAETLASLPAALGGKLVGAIDPARAGLLLGLLDETCREQTLAQVTPALAAELREIMTYPSGTVGRLMNTQVIVFHPDSRVQQALARYRRLGRQIRNLILAGDDGVLVGMIPLAAIVLADPATRLKELVKGDPPCVLATSPREEAVEVLNKVDVTTLPVVDGSMRIIGVLYHDALIQSVQEKATAGMQTMVGAGREERALSSPWFAVKKRLPWLNINLLTAFVAAAVVGLFESTIAQFTALAILLPVVAGQSGNTGAQALAVVMRGLALREIRPRHAPRVLFKEGLAGTLNGIAIAVVTAAGVWVWSGSPGLSAVIAVAMIMSMMLAGLAGAAIPLILTAIRQDPAQSGSIILTTVTDVTGFLSFLGLATIFAAIL